MNEKPHVTLEQSKHYFDSTYNESSRSLPRKAINGKRAFAVKRSSFHDLIENEQKEINIDTSLEKQYSESDFDVSSFTIPSLPKIKVLEPRQRYHTQNENNGINSFDLHSQNLESNVEYLNKQANNLLRSIEKMESMSIECKHYAEYNKVLSQSSMRQLSQISSINDRESIFQKIFDYVKSKIHVK